MKPGPKPKPKDLRVHKARGQANCQAPRNCKLCGKPTPFEVLVVKRGLCMSCRQLPRD